MDAVAFFCNVPEKINGTKFTKKKKNLKQARNSLPQQTYLRIEMQIRGAEWHPEFKTLVWKWKNKPMCKFSLFLELMG